MSNSTSERQDIEWLKSNRFFASKKMGQNFLINHDVCQAISDFLPTSNQIKYDEFIEIGPGLGALTSFLLTKANKHLNAIELDKRLSAYLAKKFKNQKNFHLFNDDFLEFDWTKLNQEATFFVVANLPYSLTSPIVLKCLQYQKIKYLYIMVQKEVGLKWTKECAKNRNAFTNLIYFYFKTWSILDIDRHNFYPQPKVDSMMIYLEKKPKKIYDPEFYRFLQPFFLHRRKKIKNNLIGKNLEHITTALCKNGFNLDARAEEIPSDKWHKIYSDWCDLCIKK